MKLFFGLSILVGYIGSLGLILADIMPTVPEGYEDWKATAIFGFITLCSIALNFFIVCKLFKAIDTLSSVKDQGQELCARMNVRPCLLKKEER